MVWQIQLISLLYRLKIIINCIRQTKSKSKIYIQWNVCFMYIFYLSGSSKVIEQETLWNLFLWGWRLIHGSLRLILLCWRLMLLSWRLSGPGSSPGSPGSNEASVLTWYIKKINNIIFLYKKSYFFLDNQKVSKNP